MWTAEDVKKLKAGSGKWTADMVRNIRAGNKVNINDPVNQLSPLERDQAEQARRSKMGTLKNMNENVKTSVTPKPTVGDTMVDGLNVIKKGVNDVVGLGKSAISAGLEGATRGFQNIVNLSAMGSEGLYKLFGVNTPGLNKEKREEYRQANEKLISDTRKDLGVDPNKISGVGNLLYNTATNIPQMLAGPVPFALSAAGGYAQDAEQKGASLGQSLAHGVVGGTTELALESALGAIPGIKNLKNITKGGVKGFLKTVAGEALEEAITDPLTKLSEKAIFNKNLPWYSKTEDAVINPKQMGQSALGGGLMATMLAPFGLGGNVQQNQQAPQQVQQPTLDKAFLEQRQTQQQVAPTMEQAIETPQAKSRQKVSETTYTPEEQAQINQFLAEDENYQSLMKELEGINIEDDEKVKKLAQTIHDKAGWKYNMTDIYRNIANQNPQFAEYVKSNFLDPFDVDKGNYARGTQATVQKVADITKKYGIRKNSLMDKALVWYREGKKTQGSDKGFFDQLRTDIQDVARMGKKKELRIPKVEPYTLQDLKRDLPNDWEKVVAADRELKPIMDDYYKRIQDTLKKIYPNVERDLEPWEKALSDLESGRGNLSFDAYRTAKAEILTKIYKIRNGKRLGHRVNYYHHYKDGSGVGIGGLADIFDNPASIDPNLAGISEFTAPKTKWEAWRQRRTGDAWLKPSAIGSMLKYIPSAEYMVNINPHIAKFRNLAKNITEGTVKTKNANNMIQFITDFADNLAGKTNNVFLDRFFTRNADSQRLAPRLIKWVNNRVKGNVVLGKFSSAINQTANIPVGIARIKDPKALTKAIGQTIAGNSAIKQSDFVTERYLSDVMDQFDTRLIDQPKNFAKWLLSAGDKLGTTFIWNGAYNKAISENNQNPVKFADEMTRSIVAGRGVGEVPLMQQASTFQLIAPFQLEVANLWHVMGDMTKEKDFAGLVVLMLANYMFNKVYEQITGNSPLFDILGAAEDALLEDDIIQSLSQGKFEIKDTNALEVAGRVAGEGLSNIPLGQSLATVFPEYADDIKTPIGNINFSRQKLFGENDPTRFGTSPLIVKGLQDPIFKLALPWGGDQLKRTIEGVDSLAKGRVEKNGKLQYLQPPTLSNLIKAPLFGKYSTGQAREYFDKNRRPLSENQTQQVMSSEDPQQAYLRIMQQRQINSLSEQIKKIAADDTMTRTEKDKKINELREKIIELRN